MFKISKIRKKNVRQTHIIKDNSCLGQKKQNLFELL